MAHVVTQNHGTVSIWIHRIPIIKIRRSYDRLIFRMGILGWWDRVCIMRWSPDICNRRNSTKIWHKPWCFELFLGNTKMHLYFLSYPDTEIRKLWPSCPWIFYFLRQMIKYKYAKNVFQWLIPMPKFFRMLRTPQQLKTISCAKCRNNLTTNYTSGIIRFAYLTGYVNMIWSYYG